jgi:uridine kinase
VQRRVDGRVRDFRLVSEAPVCRVILLAGPSGSGKTHLALGSGLPVLALDDFYKNGHDPSLPRRPELGIVDWDDPASWDAAAAVRTVAEICRIGHADVPVYDMAHDRAVGYRTFDVGEFPVFVAEGLFAAEIVPDCKQRGILADAVVLRRARWKNYVRRLIRDLREHRKPPLTVIRRARQLMATEADVIRRQLALGCRPLDAAELRRTLEQWAARARV